MRKKKDRSVVLMWRDCVCVGSNRYVVEICKDEEKNCVVLSFVNLYTRKLYRHDVTTLLKDEMNENASYRKVFMSVLTRNDDEGNVAKSEYTSLMRKKKRRHRRSSAAGVERRQSASTHDDILNPKTCLASILSGSPWLLAYGDEISTSTSLLHDLRESLNTNALAGHVAVIETAVSNMSRVLPVARNLEHALEDGDPDASSILASQLASLSELFCIDTETILKKEQERAQMLAKLDLEALKETEVEIDPNEPRILSGGNDYNFKVWSQDTERVRHSIVSGEWPKYQDRGGVVHCIAVSNKGDLAATADGDGRVRLYTLPDPELIYVFPSGPVKCVTFSLDDRYMYVAFERFSSLFLTREYEYELYLTREGERERVFNCITQIFYTNIKPKPTDTQEEHVQIQ